MAESENIQYKVNTKEDAADAKSVAVAEQAKHTQQPVDAETDGENLILGKFKSQEDLAKAYQELQKKLGTKEEVAEEEKPEQKTDEKKAQYGDIPEEFHKFQDEFVKDGKLSDASYKELEKRGYSKWHIDDYVNSKRQLAEMAQRANTQSVEQDTASVVAEAGGEESYEAMTGWAKDNMSQAEKVAYNKIVNEGSIDEKRLAVRGLRAKFEDANGKPAKLLKGEPSKGVVPYESNEQWMRDMKNPLYDKDPAFREKVLKKLSVSEI